MTATCTTKRYYTINGITVGVRDSVSGQVSYLLGDNLGSTSMTVNATTGSVAAQRYLPYGGIRSSSGTQATEKGWIGQTKDSSTGLQYLNARYYDPALGRFAAVDPLISGTNVGSLDAYGYANDSPITNSDPTGLFCVDAAEACNNRPPVRAPVAPPEPVPSTTAELARAMDEAGVGADVTDTLSKGFDQQQVEVTRIN